MFSTALLKVDFGSQSQSRVPDFYSTFVKKSTLKSTLLHFKSGISDHDLTPPRRSTPSPKPYLKSNTLEILMTTELNFRTHNVRFPQ